jgi:predicted DNA-binding protein (MmcQ/YjbR family)
MDAEIIRNYAMSKKGVTESFPFDDTTLVLKVANKMFCLVNIVPPISINVKCDPEKALELREEYEGVLPGYHMNKRHWNTVMINQIVDSNLIYQWIDDSYNLIVASLPKKLRKEFEGMG